MTDKPEPTRTPHKPVRDLLLREVRYGCPVCGSPYLTWHHFDPPWRERHHEDPAGIIPLCQEHHDKADAGAYTIEQLREMKRNPYLANSEVSGEFEWRRQKVLAIVGSNAAYECPIVLKYGAMPLIWLTRNDAGEQLINLRMLTASGEPRLLMEDNGWLLLGDPTEFICPPSGRLIHVKYANGDTLHIEFKSYDSLAALQARLPGVDAEWARLIGMEFPLTVVEVNMEVGGTPIAFRPRGTTLGGTFAMYNFTARCSVGYAINANAPRAPSG